MSAEAEDEGELSPAKDAGEGWRKSGRKDCRILRQYRTILSAQSAHQNCAVLPEWKISIIQRGYVSRPGGPVCNTVVTVLALYCILVGYTLKSGRRRETL